MSLKRCREATNMTQKMAATLLGLDQSTVALWETGKTMPRASLLPKISELYECTIDDLLKPEE